jgi:hypothetical protein
MPRYFVLDPTGEPIESTLAEWGTWLQHAHTERRLRHTLIDPDVSVSTVFLGLDHGWILGDPPALWETMIFGGSLNGYQERYSSREAALLGHEVAVELALSKVEPEIRATFLQPSKPPEPPPPEEDEGPQTPGDILRKIGFID